MKVWEKGVPFWSEEKQYTRPVAYPENYTELNQELKRKGENWHFIGPGTKITDGLYVPPERDAHAIMVDVSQNPDIYRTYIHEVKERVARMSYSDDNRLYLTRAVRQTVEGSLSDWSAGRTGEESYVENLSDLMRSGGGRNKLYPTVLSAALLDIMTSGVYVSIEARSKDGLDDDVRDREIRRWVTYEEPRSRGGRIEILDWEAGVFGPLSDAADTTAFEYRKRIDSITPAPIPKRVTSTGAKIIQLADYVHKRKEKD